MKVVRKGPEPYVLPPAKWVSKPPVACDTCRKPLSKFFVDGKTRMGPWATMCVPCHQVLGVGLGTGLGQKFDLTTLEKVEG